MRIDQLRRGVVIFIAGAVCTGPILTIPSAAAYTRDTAAIGAANGETAEQWTPTLSTLDSDDTNVRYAGGRLRLAKRKLAAASERSGRDFGALVLSPHRLSAPANRVRATLQADVPSGSEVSIEARGHDGQQWTEWLKVSDDGAVFTEPASSVQVRLTLSTTEGAPSVRTLQLTADTWPYSAAARSTTPLTYRVYATREGLVGYTTANGHVITTQDHFVALPSRRGLSPRGTGDYSVRVCSTVTGRCAYAPVWDVGPWNVKDDYWNPSTVREMWKDLPQGKPEAQAAYLEGYNGGLDGFGRKVLNPAGIDLADGTFWDGVGLSDNSWVNVSYLWTATGPRGRVSVTGGTLAVRSGPSSTNTAVGLVADRTHVNIECQVTGQTVTGPFGTSSLWDRIGPGNFVSHAYVEMFTIGRPGTCLSRTS